jgi:prevent-host-death family protein
MRQGGSGRAAGPRWPRLIDPRVSLDHPRARAMDRLSPTEVMAQLPKLLAQVAKGRWITIVKHGVPVAMLVPASRPRTHPVDKVIRALLAFRKGRSLGTIPLRLMIDRGRP